MEKSKSSDNFITDNSAMSENDALFDKPWRNVTIHCKLTKSAAQNEGEEIQDSKPAIQSVYLTASGKATVIIMCGICIAMFGLTKLCVLFELCGFCLLFREPVFYGILNRTPYVGTLLSVRKAQQDRDYLKIETENYEPINDLLKDEANFPHVNILLFGPVGAGKSSFLNTVCSVFREKIFNVARSGSSEHSLTMKFTRNELISKRTGQLLKFRLWDTRGVENEQFMEKDNMTYMLQGNIPHKLRLDQRTPISSDMPGFIKTPSLEDMVHCVAIVIDASMVEAADAIKDTIQNIKEMQIVMNLHDVPQVILLTNVDRVCQHSKNDVLDALKSKLIAKTVGQVSEMFGLAEHCIFPVKNYEKECELDTNTDILALLALRGILNSADTFLYLHREEILKNYPATEKLWGSRVVNGGTDQNHNGGHGGSHSQQGNSGINSRDGGSDTNNGSQQQRRGRGKGGQRGGPHGGQGRPRN